ncbi:MAG: 50S ribosomal protein L24 [Bacillota bacterium]|nr:50S ribosomal protein L24 [Bacillota bacterium]
MAKVHVKTGDQVYVLRGKDKARTGRVLRVLPASNRVVVEGVNIVTKHAKPRSQSQQGGIMTFEAPIAAANVMLVCPSCQRPSKVARRFNDEGVKVRVCKACDAEISEISKPKRR